MSDGLQIQQLLGSSDTSMPVNSKQPVILRTASFEDIERQGKGLLLALFKRLRRHGGVAGLALTPRQNLSRPQNDFLGDVATLPNFDIIGDFMSCEEDYRQGDEWRIAPVSFSKKEATCDGRKNL
ncbi:hypothetical protein DOTSEDRAFT_28658 [Dothistroma septosporum NZE10]|uniref:Uncharacterized protein n=1 Tax=Dothistroma septosporum (strain NZE10 / CBS 128990) TaxID=675120 RepID=M2Y2J7_DOTSN|nr:hypothetical protein DOTSEDRAFT_28658 [Dothistroma septosporum NZE10]